MNLGNLLVELKIRKVTYGMERWDIRKYSDFMGSGFVLHLPFLLFRFAWDDYKCNLCGKKIKMIKDRDPVFRSHKLSLLRVFTQQIQGSDGGMWDWKEGKRYHNKPFCV